MTPEKLKEHYAPIIERCERVIENVNAAIAKFADEIKENPHHAFQWADNRMEDAAKWKVAHVIKAMAERAIEKEIEPREFNRVIRDQALQESKYMKRSTSASSNFIDTATGCEWVQSMDRFDGLAGGRDI